MSSKLRFIGRTMAVALALSLTAAAHADTYDYTVTETGSVDATYTFALSSNPTPYLDNPYYFQVAGVTVDVNGVPQPDSTIYFFTSLDGGGLETAFLDLAGAQLFTGTTTDPTLITGDFTLQDVGGPGEKSVTVDVTDATAAAVTPEPSSLLLMGTGTLMIAFMMRKRMLQA